MHTPRNPAVKPFGAAHHARKTPWNRHGMSHEDDTPCIRSGIPISSRSAIQKKTCFPGWDQQVNVLRAELERRSALLHRAEPSFVACRHELCRRRGCAGLGHQQIRTEQGLRQNV